MTEWPDRPTLGPIVSLFVAKEAAASCRLDGETMPWPPRGDSFDDGPGGQMTHSQPWSMDRSSSSTAFVECNADLTADECRAMANQLATVAAVLDGKPLGENEKMSVIRIKGGRLEPRYVED